MQIQAASCASSAPAKAGRSPVLVAGPSSGVATSQTSGRLLLLDRFSRVTLAQWLHVGQVIVRDKAGRASRALAWATVKETIFDRELALAAWFAADDIDTLFFLASRTTQHLTRVERAQLASAREAAKSAALAELARDFISPGDLETLSLPVS